MKNEKLNPVAQMLLILLLVAFLVIFLFSFLMVFAIDDDIFEEIRNKYELGLMLSIVISPLAYMYLLYFLINYTVKKNEVKLVETKPIIQWNYKKYYWDNFKTKEFQKRGRLYAFRLTLIWLPISLFLFLIYQAEPLVAIVSFLLVLVCAIPMVPFTLGKFYGEYKNQLLQTKIEVKIYKKGLTINNAYYPYNHYQDEDNNLRLINV